MKYLKYELESCFIGGLERIYNIKLNEADFIMYDEMNTGIRLIDIDLLNNFIDYKDNDKLNKVTVLNFLIILNERLEGLKK